MSDKAREVSSLRTIVVSGRAALRKARDARDTERIQDRVHELLADLEESVLRDGADPDVLAAIERKRRDLWEP